MDWLIGLFSNRTIFERVIGVCIILFACYNRFYTPATNRSSTTAVRFHLAAFCYAMSSVILYAFLILWPDYINMVVNMSGTQLPAYLQNLAQATPLVIAVAIGLVLPTLPGFSRVDHGVRKWFERRAAIPNELSALATRLANDKLDIDRGHRDAVNRERSRFLYGALDEAVVAKPNDSLGNAVTRLICLRMQLDDWGQSDRGLKVLPEAVGLQALRDEFESHRQSVCAYMKLRGPADAGSQALVPLRAALLDATRSLTHKFAVNTSRSALILFFTHETPLDKFTVFQLTKPVPSMDWNKWALILMALFVTIMACMTASVLLEQTGGKSPSEMYSTGLMIFLIFIWATVCSVAPRRYLHRRSTTSHEPPWLCYLVSCLCSVVGAFVISFGFRVVAHALSNSTLIAAWQEQASKYPFLLLPLGLSFLVAVLLDIRMPFEHRLLAASLLRGVLVGITVAGLAVLAHALLLRIGTPGPPPIGPFTATCFAIGMTVGALVPHYYRQAHRQPAVERAG